MYWTIDTRTLCNYQLDVVLKVYFIQIDSGRCGADIRWVGGLDHHQFAEQCDLYTGGLHVSPHISTHHTDQSLFEKARTTSYMYAA